MEYFVFLFWCAGNRNTSRNIRWNTLYFYSGVPGIEIQDGILCISILHSVPGIEIIRFIKHHVKADIQNEKKTCRPIKTTGGKRYLAS